jgi:uncharacterized protein involved in exopolysaccharide biosynthesis
MIESVASPPKSGIFKLITNRWTRYIVLTGVANAVLWGAALSYLKVTKPTYTSQWALILPGGSFGVNVNLPDIGQANTSNGSGTGNSTFDPRANYEYIFTSDTVMVAAAAIAKVPPEAFGKPRIKLLDNTTLMEFAVTGKSPVEAQKKSYALFQAITIQINALRTREISQRQGPTQKILLSAQKKLQDAQLKLSTYKVSSGLSFPEQLNNLSVNIEQLRRLRAETIAQEQQATKRVHKLGSDLKLPSQQAAEAFLIQSDRVLQENLKNYSEATAALEVLMAKFGPNHPQVLKETKRQAAAGQALLLRGQLLLGRTVDQATLMQLGLTSNGAGRDPLLQNLVTLQAEQRGLQGQVKALDQQIKPLEERLETLAGRQSTLDNLKRDSQIAEAIFASTIAKLDLGQGDIFSAYPLVQIAVEPSLAKEPTAPKKTIILAGAALGSVFVTLGLTLLWIRKPWGKKLSQLISS